MLALTRRDQQKITITTPTGEIITVQVLQLQNGKVRLGFEAPNTYAIDRTEALERNNITRRLIMEGKHEL
jgi:carbon storage regulator CsrA